MSTKLPSLEITTMYFVKPRHFPYEDKYFKLKSLIPCSSKQYLTTG